VPGRDCLACDLASGRVPLPGGVLHRTSGWCVEHCVGPLGLGALIVKPLRHVTAVADLSEAEALELGPLLRLSSAVAGRLVDADQVYNCLWSHRGGRPVHIHYVVQPVTGDQMAALDAYGPALQVAQFADATPPDTAAVEALAVEARRLFATG
jgi:diadenosine tetraphosphate (Ap4A) HIT family hydrolase